MHTLFSVAPGLVLLVWIVFFMVWLALRRLILPHIDEGRPAVERRADSPAAMGELRTTAPAKGAAPPPDTRPPE